VLQAIHYAALANQPAMIVLLVEEFGADFEVYDLQMFTPLAWYSTHMRTLCRIDITRSILGGQLIPGNSLVTQGCGIE